MLALTVIAAAANAHAADIPGHIDLELLLFSPLALVLLYVRGMYRSRLRISSSTGSG
jgi:hypothetical protein